VIIDFNDYLSHIGMPRRSGRYPWGSGGDATSNSRGFLQYVDEMRTKGLTDNEIRVLAGMTSTEFRNLNSIAKNALKQERLVQMQRLIDKGYSNPKIAEIMGLAGESSVRALRAEGVKEKTDILQNTATRLRNRVQEVKYLDIGAGVEQHMGITDTKLKQAVSLLQMEGYNKYQLKVDQLGTGAGMKTTMKVLTAPETTWGELVRNQDKIQQIFDVSDDGGRTYFGMVDPLSINSSRVAVKYKEDGGDKADGTIYVRPNVDDVSLGKAQYAQVRIAVDGTHYLKGMAMYKTDLPDGVDLQFNTNKSDTGNKLDAMKPMAKDKNTGKIDKDNPFGAQISNQILTKDSKGKDKTTSVMNIVNQEGDWSGWSNTLSTQFLSKQSTTLAREQLDKTYNDRVKDLDEIMSLTNPTVRKALLKTHSDAADSAAVHLKAAALPRQGSYVILPINSLPKTQVYAPRFKNGETVVLIRFPHGGTFEIPELTVNNNHRESKSLLKDAKDAIGINAFVAERLSGADFDGDTVLVIPNSGNKIKSTAALEDLKNFDPRSRYKGYEGMPKMSSATKGQQMGDVSNLITDMTIKKASMSEIARAVKHSMVVIDAEKHDLNWQQSAIDNNIKALKKKYQGKTNAGAATLISRKKTEDPIPERKERSAGKGGAIDKATGKKMYEETNNSYVNKKGETVFKKTYVNRLAEIDDANKLTSNDGVGTPMERLYANHSNRLKALADQSRKEMVNTPLSTYSPSAAKTYAPEVAKLNAKLAIALRNAPLERQAQVYANITLKAKKDQYPDMDKVTENKVRSQALTGARLRTKADKKAASIEITPKEWEAIQAGAIHDNKLKDILKNTDIDLIREYAMPKTKVLMSPSKTARALKLLASGATRAEVAEALGVSLSTLDLATSEG